MAAHFTAHPENPRNQLFGGVCCSDDELGLKHFEQTIASRVSVRFRYAPSSGPWHSAQHCSGKGFRARR